MILRCFAVLMSLFVLFTRSGAQSAHGVTFTDQRNVWMRRGNRQFFFTTVMGTYRQSAERYGQPRRRLFVSYRTSVSLICHEFFRSHNTYTHLSRLKVLVSGSLVDIAGVL